MQSGVRGNGRWVTLLAISIFWLADHRHPLAYSHAHQCQMYAFTSLHWSANEQFELLVAFSARIPNQRAIRKTYVEVYPCIHIITCLFPIRLRRREHFHETATIALARDVLENSYAAKGRLCSWQRTQRAQDLCRRDAGQVASHRSCTAEVEGGCWIQCKEKPRERSQCFRRASSVRVTPGRRNEDKVIYLQILSRILHLPAVSRTSQACQDEDDAAHG
mmetsp:Transcript_15181/g.26836  ORF Transcript_15181/g.26836 Transcript_15181/m.26836 type:complete len:219 (-) Transcript_15181:2-658(-)